MASVQDLSQVLIVTCPQVDEGVSGTTEPVPLWPGPQRGRPMLPKPQSKVADRPPAPRKNSGDNARKRGCESPPPEPPPRSRSHEACFSEFDPLPSTTTLQLKHLRVARSHASNTFAPQDCLPWVRPQCTLEFGAGVLEPPPPPHQLPACPSGCPSPSGLPLQPPTSLRRARSPLRSPIG